MTPDTSDPSAIRNSWDDPEFTEEPTTGEVCIAHGSFVPCRKEGQHRTTTNQFWVKSVQDFQGSTIAGLTWEPAWERRLTFPTTADRQRDELRAEVERLRVTVARVEALADEWADEAVRYRGYVAGSMNPDMHRAVAKTLNGNSASLRAVLAGGVAADAPTSSDGGARLPNRCSECGDCYHPAFGPGTDGEPCDWCQDCGCPSAAHTEEASR